MRGSAVLRLVALWGLASSCAQTTPTPVPAAASSPFRLTILHNNDGESQLLHAGAGAEAFGGVARFATVLADLRRAAGAATVVVSSGDNVLPGPELTAALAGGTPFFDGAALRHLEYDAIALGNHDFDLGPDVLAGLVNEVDNTPFLAANIDLDDEVGLAALRHRGRIAGHVVVDTGGQKIGLIGLVTPTLASISAPRRVRVLTDLTAVVAREVRALEAIGVRTIVLLSHLQDLEHDLALVATLRGVDAVVAGGGDELMASPGHLLVPGDDKRIVGPYPHLAPDAEGRPIPIVTTPGSYRYVGRLILEVDRDGQVVAIDPGSGLVRVAAPPALDGVAPDPVVERDVVAPLQVALGALSTRVIGRSEVPLDGLRSSVRGGATNLGDLVADALRWQAAQAAPAQGLPSPQIGLINGGGIRNDSVIPAGSITELDTFDILPFPNFVAVVPKVPVGRLRAILEHALANTGGGAYLHVSGLRVEHGTDAKIRRLILEDGTVLLDRGEVVEGAPTVDVATISFLAGGGGGAPFVGLPCTNVPATYQQALASFIGSASGLAGVATADRYPVGGTGRLRGVD